MMIMMGLLFLFDELVEVEAKATTATLHHHYYHHRHHLIKCRLLLRHLRPWYHLVTVTVVPLEVLQAYNYDVVPMLSIVTIRHQKVHQHERQKGKQPQEAGGQK